MGNTCITSSLPAHNFFKDSITYRFWKSGPAPASPPHQQQVPPPHQQQGSSVEFTEQAKSKNHLDNPQKPPETIVIHSPVITPPRPNPPKMPPPQEPLDMYTQDLASSVLGRHTENLKDLYSLGRKLGQGQFGTTYLCIDKSTGEEYACKSIAKRKLISSEDVDDVRREIQIMHHLSGHPNIVNIKGAYEDITSVHLVMELCAGGELFDRIIQRGHYTERKAAELTRTIVGVVETCHSLGVMHRDLKPENFLFSNKNEDSALKTTDFGLSVFFRPGEIFHDVVGSPYYVAPEVLCKHYGPAADVWSAGVILYILLSGVPPFWAGWNLGELAHVV